MFRRANQRSSRSSTRAEVSHRKSAQLIPGLRPLRCECHTTAEQIDIESMLSCVDINGFFLAGQKIEKECRESTIIEELGNSAVAAAEPAAATAVREHHQPFGIVRHLQIRPDFTL